jgi:hypothetical protein
MTTLMYDPMAPEKISAVVLNRFDLINLIIQNKFPFGSKYLEIGLRNADDCFNKVIATDKHAVDPGTEIRQMPENVELYNTTSDEFFKNLEAGNLDIPKDYKWDIIFVDGLHLADQVYRDLCNASNYLNPEGFILANNCNPDHWQKAHSDYDDYLKAQREWNGTVWKAIYRARTEWDCMIYTIDSDQGICVINMKKPSTKIPHTNVFYEYGVMKDNREDHLGLVSPITFIKNLDKYL